MNFIISVFDLRNQLVQILELMLVNLDHTKSLIVILIQDTFNAGGFSGSGITKKQAVVGFFALDERFRVVDQLLLWNFVADKVGKAHIRDVGDRDDLNIFANVCECGMLCAVPVFLLQSLCRTESYHP